MAFNRINVFTIGDSADVNTWSNLPFYLCSALERFVTLRRINLLPDGAGVRRALRVINPLSRLVAASHMDVFRSRLHERLIEGRLARLGSTLETADLNLFLTFSFSSHAYSPVPVAHYCDRTYEHFLEEHAVQPTPVDRYFIEREKQHLRHAFRVFVTNELCSAFIRGRYAVNRILKLPAGINMEATAEPDALIAEKLQSKDIVFIAREAYRRGVDILIDAFLHAAADARDWRLHIVGVSPDEVPTRDPRIRVYGYLRKDLPEERAVYDGLLRRARLFVCPVRAGQPPTGVIREAQMMCTPVIIPDVSDGRELVSDGYNGVLTRSLDPKVFAHHMVQLLENDRLWSRLARGAHESVKRLTWDRTAAALLDAVRSGARGDMGADRRQPGPSAASTYSFG